MFTAKDGTIKCKGKAKLNNRELMVRLCLRVAVNYASEFPGAVGITLSRQSQNGKDGESTSERLHTK
eukprot:5801480-Pyramimonas_sp.AAC.1